MRHTMLKRFVDLVNGIQELDLSERNEFLGLVRSYYGVVEQPPRENAPKSRKWIPASTRVRNGKKEKVKGFYIKTRNGSRA